MISLNLKDHWNVFEFMMRTPDPSRIPFQCLAGCTALEVTLATFWKHEVLPEWAELVTYAHVLLENSEVIDGWARLTNSELDADQWKDHLRHLTEAALSPNSMAPTFTDFALAASLLQGSRWQDPSYVGWIRAIISMDRLRQSENERPRLLETILQIKTHGSRYSPFFLFEVEDQAAQQEEAA